MTNLNISIACGDYDRVRALSDRPAGIDDCRREIETPVGYVRDRGLPAQRLTVENIFRPATFTVSKT